MESNKQNIRMIWLKSPKLQRFNSTVHSAYCLQSPLIWPIPNGMLCLLVPPYRLTQTSLLPNKLVQQDTNRALGHFLCRPLSGLLGCLFLQGCLPQSGALGPAWCHHCNSLAPCHQKGSLPDRFSFTYLPCTSAQLMDSMDAIPNRMHFQDVCLTA